MNDYAHCATLTRDQWAWAFLRRNPEYQADFRQFIALWQALESDYGMPPQRDFSHWKRDPRAYGPLPGNNTLNTPSGELCLSDGERILIECWMGAKWGFYKFPIDPERSIPPNPDELTWRPPPLPSTPPDTPYRLDISFDLSLPLPPQLEAAKFRLISHTSALRRTGLAAPMTVANQRTHWTQLVRLLDAQTTDQSDQTMEEKDARLLREAQAMTQRGYLDILRLNAAE